MRGIALTLLLFPLAAASAPAQPAVEPLDQELKQAETEQAVAEAQAARLEGVAARARGDARVSMPNGRRPPRASTLRRRGSARPTCDYDWLRRKSPPSVSGLRPNSSRCHPCSPAWRRWRGARRCWCSPTAAVPTNLSACACCSTRRCP